MFSKQVNTSKNIDEILTGDYPQFIDFINEITAIQQRYTETKFDMKVFDYDDLLTKLAELLTKAPSVRQKLHEQFKYIMVDEYQDTNRIQSEIIKLLVGPGCALTVVGDDAQSIYSFRGAHFKNIIDFPKQFDDTQMITLEQNYRSTQKNTGFNQSCD